MTGDAPLERRQVMEHLANKAAIARAVGRDDAAEIIAGVARDLARNRHLDQRPAAAVIRQIAAERKPGPKKG